MKDDRHDEEYSLRLWDGCGTKSFLPFCVFTSAVYMAMKMLTTRKQRRTGNRHTAMVAVSESIRSLTMKLKFCDLYQ